MMVSVFAQKSIEFPKYEGKMNIDGVASESVWSDSKVAMAPIDVVFEGEEKGFEGSDDLKADFKGFYNNNELVLFVSVTDDIACTAQSRWKGDKIEIYFGLPGYDEYDGACQKNGRQFAVMGYDFTEVGWGKDAGSGAQCEQYPGADKYETSGVRWMTKETDNGYDIEIAISKLAMNEMEFVAGGKVAFDISVNDVDDPDLSDAEQKRYRKSWNNNGSVAENWSKLLGLGTINFGSVEIASQTNGFNQLYNNNISIYPNPSSDLITIQGVEKVNISIFDLTGKLVLKAEKAKTVNISQLQKGAYFAEFTTIDGDCLGTTRIVRK
jgi:hypothetical protein